MKFVKVVDGKKVTIEEINKNHFSMLEREGFEAEEQVDPEREALLNKAAELGIKNTHNMKTETLIAKIAEVESKTE